MNQSEGMKMIDGIIGETLKKIYLCKIMNMNFHSLEYRTIDVMKFSLWLQNAIQVQVNNHYVIYFTFHSTLNALIYPSLQHLWTSINLVNVKISAESKFLDI